MAILKNNIFNHWSPSRGKLILFSLFYIFCSSCCIYTPSYFSRIQRKHLKKPDDKITVYYETPEAILYFNYRDFVKEITNDWTDSSDFTKHIMDEYDLLSKTQDSISMDIYKDHLLNWYKDDWNSETSLDYSYYPLIGYLIDRRWFSIYDKDEKHFVDEIRIRYDYRSISDGDPEIYYEFKSGDKYILLYHSSYLMIKKIPVIIY